MGYGFPYKKKFGGEVYTTAYIPKRGSVSMTGSAAKRACENKAKYFRKQGWKARVFSSPDNRYAVYVRR